MCCLSPSFPHTGGGVAGAAGGGGERDRPVEVHPAARGGRQGKVRNLQAAAEARRRPEQEEQGRQHGAGPRQGRRHRHTGSLLMASESVYWI